MYAGLGRVFQAGLLGFRRKDNQQVKRYQKPEGPDWRKGQ
jgi:hypothetical protein